MNVLGTSSPLILFCLSQHHFAVFRIVQCTRLTCLRRRNCAQRRLSCSHRPSVRHATSPFHRVVRCNSSLLPGTTGNIWRLTASACQHDLICCMGSSKSCDVERDRRWVAAFHAFYSDAFRHLLLHEGLGEALSVDCRQPPAWV
jgi:hypothetical protein